MDNNLHNSYLFQALDAYPYNLEETLEALNYALSYNSSDAHALYLMGRVYAEQLEEYETAKAYFAEAVAKQLEKTIVYPHYISTLLMNEDYEEAQKLIDFALTVKGTDKARIKLLQGYLFEYQKEYKKAIKVFKEANKMATNDNFIDYVEKCISRAKNKMKPEKKPKNKRKKKKKK